MPRGNEPYSQYQATLIDCGTADRCPSDKVESQAFRRRESRCFDTPSELLSPGVYILNLKGVLPVGHVEDLDDYTFQVPSR